MFRSARYWAQEAPTFPAPITATFFGMIHSPSCLQSSVMHTGPRSQTNLARVLTYEFFLGKEKCDFKFAVFHRV